MARKTCFIFVVFVISALALRIPFISRYLYFVDSVIYGLAMERFDIANGTPAAPGSVAYVYAGKLFYHFTNDANVSLVLAGILFSGLGCGMAYLLGRAMYGELTGIIAALLLLTSPLAWFFGEIAMPVISNIFFSILIAFFSYRVITTTRLYPLILSAISLGIGSAFRQDILIFLFPLWLWSISKRPFRHIFIAAFMLIFTSLVWIIPSSISSGSFTEYLLLCRERIFSASGHISYMTSHNIFVKKMHLYNYFLAVLTSLFLGIFPFFYYPGRFFNPCTIIRDKKIQFLILWILPSFIYMNLVGGNRSYIFAHLGAILVYVSIALKAIYDDFSRAGFVRLGSSILSIIIILILSVNIFFFFHDPHPQRKWSGTSWFRVSDIQKRDHMLKVKFDYIKTKFSPEDAIIFAGGPRQTYWPLLYYLPSYKVYQPDAVYWALDKFMEMGYEHRQETLSGPVFKIPEDIKNIIFFDEDIYPYIRSQRALEKITLEGGYCLYILRVERERDIKLELHRLEIS